MERDPLLVLALGFLLTTVAGGTLTFFFQRQAWRHQYDAQRRDLQRAQAQEAFDSLSTIMDRRLYRMRLVFYAARRLAQQDAASPRLEDTKAQYRVVLSEWNDNLNRNLALVETHFGQAARRYLGEFLYEEFRSIGEELNQFLHEVDAPDRDATRVRPIARRLNGLSHSVYEFDLHLLRALRERKLGDEADVGDSPLPLQRNVIRFGDIGADVMELQQALAARGEPLDIDGHFGVSTERALVAVQEREGMAERFVAGRETRAALGEKRPPGEEPREFQP